MSTVNSGFVPPTSVPSIAPTQASMPGYELELLYWAIISISCLSLIGAALIMGSWLFASCRSPTRKLVVFLSITDFFSAICYLTAVILIKQYQNHADTIKLVCQVIAPINIFFTCSSFFWTACIAIHLYLSVTMGRNSLEKIKYYHIISWGYPLFSMILVFALRAGDRADANSFWYEFCNLLDRVILVHSIRLASSIPLKCEILINVRCFIKYPENPNWIPLRCVTIYIPILICWCLAFIFYFMTKSKFMKYFDKQQLIQGRIQSKFALSRKLTFIPLVFILLRMWGMVASIIQWISSGNFAYEKFLWLEFLHSLGDPGQGFVNAFFYVIFSKKIRKSYARCLYCNTDHEVDKSSLIQ